MELYESQYFIILVPSVVITVIFLFFWLFMKETSYDEVLAKQKRDQKPPPAKADKKKSEKKKNKKRENQNGTLHESDTESVSREFELVDTLAVDEEPIIPIPSAVPEVSVSLKERKKKDKRPTKSVQEELPAKEVINGSKPTGKKVEPIPVTKQPTPPSDVPSSKKKSGQKQKKNGTDNAHTVQDVKVESVAIIPKKVEPVMLSLETKQQESGTGKKKATPKKLKTLVDEPVAQPTSYIPLLDNTEPNPSAEKKREHVAELEKVQIESVQKTGMKKLKDESDKENAEVKFKDLLVVLKSMRLTEEEAGCLADALKDKSNVIQDIWQKQAGKGDPAVMLHQLQARENLLASAEEEASVAKEKCKQLNQELLTEKQKASVVETKLRERNSTLEKEYGSTQSKLQVQYQETKQMQLKLQQLESQTARLQQENNILRDAVSSASNQMESKQSSEMSKLRQDYSRLMAELTETNSKLQQEEVQKNNAEQTVGQVKVQLQETERRWEDMQKYLRNLSTEHEKAETAKQELQTKLLGAESEIQSLHTKLTDTMVSKQQIEERMIRLLDAEQKRATAEDSLQLQVQELLEQKEAMKDQIQKLLAQVAAQVNTSSLVEELQKTIVDKDKCMKQLQESLTVEQVHLTKKEEDFQVKQSENRTLRDEIEKLRAQISEQNTAAILVEQMQKSLEKRLFNISTRVRKLHQMAGHQIRSRNTFSTFSATELSSFAQLRSLQPVIGDFFTHTFSSCYMYFKNNTHSTQEKDDKIKTIEELLETGLIEMANKEEDLKPNRVQNNTFIQDLICISPPLSSQDSSASLVEELQKAINEKDGKIKSIEGLLQNELLTGASKEKTIQALEQDNKALKEDLQNMQLQSAEQVNIKGLRGLAGHRPAMWRECTRGNLLEMNRIQTPPPKIVRTHSKYLITKMPNLKCIQYILSTSQLQDLQETLKEKEALIKCIEATVEEKTNEALKKVKRIRDLQKENESLTSQLQLLKEQNVEQAFLTSQTGELQKTLTEKENKITELQSELVSQTASIEQQRKKNNELREKNWKAMEALSSTEKMLQEKVNRTAKESQQQLETVEKQTRDVLQKLFPNMALPSKASHCEWMKEFEKLAAQSLSQTTPSEDTKALEQKLKESEEMHTMLQLECEKYKVVLAETEGILQRLQSSVEEEESRWKLKIEESQKELSQIVSIAIKSVSFVVALLYKGTSELKREREHLEIELEKAEVERTTYVTEVRELKDLLTELQKKLDDSYSEAVRQNEELNLLKKNLTETLLKLETEQSERQKVAGDLYKAQQSLDLIQSEIVKASGDSIMIENNDASSEGEFTEKKEKMTASLNQTVTQLQELLQSVNQQLTKGQEHPLLVG
uniref:Kinectin 1 n=1 Tax=Latimeria chalumnae TaxID=7897 RepID=H3BID2_LATCH